ncbi:MAG: ABC transporter ATP-binding protein [Patescibacteria group bacterium]
MNAEQQGVNFTSWQLIKDIFQLTKPYKFRFIVASLIRVAGDLAQLYPAFAFASTVVFLTHYSAGQSLTPLWVIIGLWFGATIIRALSQFFSKFSGYWIAERVALDVTLKAVQHLFLLDMVWHERENSGNKIKRVQNAADAYTKILRLWFNSIIEVIVNLVAISIIISRFDHTVLGVLIVFLISYFIISAIMTRRAGNASYAVNAREEDVNGLLFEAINNIRTVKVMAMAKTLYATIVKGTEALFGKILIRIFWYQSRNSFLSFWAAAFKIGIIVIIVKGIMVGNYEIGFLILFNSYFSDLRESIDELSVASVDFVTSRFSIARMRTILDEPVTIDDENKKNILPTEWQKIVLKNVSFAYGENEVLNDISFEVRRGEKVGIVGLSGAGKSTLFKLLLKEREDYSGDVFFDDLSIKLISKIDYFKHVSVVLQDTEVFNFSLKDNITITNNKKKTNQKLLQQALTTAHMAEVVNKLPNGLDTIIGEKGVKLSGGERQRLGIARAVFKEPQILLLDEATSHLDLESEQKIRDSLHKFFENVTAIVIAHRLTTIKEMDKILVIEDGKIVESGTFDELQARGGRFRELWDKQKL